MARFSEFVSDRDVDFFIMTERDPLEITSRARALSELQLSGRRLSPLFYDERIERNRKVSLEEFRSLRESPISELLQPNRRIAVRQRTQVRAKAVAADRRNGMVRRSGPKTVFGTFAKSFVSLDSRRGFVSPPIVLPCVQRVVRRQVMFAKRHAGKAHRGARRWTELSNIGC